MAEHAGWKISGHTIRFDSIRFYGLTFFFFLSFPFSAFLFSFLVSLGRVIGSSVEAASGIGNLSLRWMFFIRWFNCVFWINYCLACVIHLGDTRTILVCLFPRGTRGYGFDGQQVACVFVCFFEAQARKKSNAENFFEINLQWRSGPSSR